MLVITVALLHGTIRAAAAEDSTLTGTSTAEWPPSPARLYQALVAADGTGERCRVTPGPIGLDLLESPPLIHAVTVSDAPVSAVSPRFVVIDEAKQGAVQNYPGRVAQAIRPGARVAPRVPVVAYVWPDARPSDAQLAALRARAARVPYLGAADSPVQVQVGTDLPPSAAGLPVWAPDRLGDTDLPVAYPGFLDALDVAFEDFTAGRPRRRSWLPSLLAAYTAPGAATRVEDPTAPGVWLRFDHGIPGRRVRLVAETLRAALLEGADRVAGGRDLVPEVIHGHHPAGTTGVEHVRVLPLPNAGYPHADGRIHGACVWFPPGTPAADVELARAALAGVDRLVCPEVFDVAVAGFDGARVPWASNPARWVGPSRAWVSVFPVVHERRVKGPLTVAEVARWCAWSGLPEPVALREARVPLVPGAVALDPVEVYHGEQRRPYSHLALTFADPVTGPVALGRGRHFGLGLMAPIPDEHHG